MNRKYDVTIEYRFSVDTTIEAGSYEEALENAEELAQELGFKYIPEGMLFEHEVAYVEEAD